MKPRIFRKNFGEKSNPVSMSKMRRVHNLSRVNRLTNTNQSFKPLRGGITISPSTPSNRSLVWRDIKNLAYNLDTNRIDYGDLQVSWNRGSTAQLIEERARLTEIQRKAIDDEELKEEAPSHVCEHVHARPPVRLHEPAHHEFTGDQVEKKHQDVERDQRQHQLV